MKEEIVSFSQVGEMKKDDRYWERTIERRKKARRNGGKLKKHDGEEREMVGEFQEMRRKKGEGGVKENTRRKENMKWKDTDKEHKERIRTIKMDRIIKEIRECKSECNKSILEADKELGGCSKGGSKVPATAVDAGVERK